ncbi:MAG: sel1 repeat family protein [Erysipelotrichia bacterium]|nr:sel1 repeat family protein [Erysipelotrichia bacterium]
MKKFLLIVIAIMLCSSAFCDEWEDAKAAHEKGDYATSIKLFNKLAEQDNFGAQFFLGDAYHKGKGVSKDMKEAMKWYLKAAQQGFENAQFIVGVLYLKGEDVPQDYEEAYFWQYLAAFQDAKFSMLLDQTASKLTPEKIEKVKARCLTWLENFAKLGDSK